MTAREKLKKAKTSLIPWAICFSVYCGLLLVEALFFGGDMYVCLSSLCAGAALIVSATVMFFALPYSDYMSLIACTVTQVVFLLFGAYIKELEFYFFASFLLVSVMSFVKNFKSMAIFLTASIIMDILGFIFIFPRLDIMNSFRFFMQFVMFVCGAVSMLIQTYNVTQKETDADKALSAFSSLLKSTPNLMVITDEDTRIRYISQPMADFAHFTKQEFALDQPLIDLFTDKALKLMFADILDADGFVQTIMSIQIDNEERHFKVIADKLSGDAGGLFIDISDITPMVNAKKSAEEAQIHAEIANASKSRFLASMSHEIRTPMNAILGITEIELGRENILPDTQESLYKVYNSGHTLLGIINDILDLSKIETGKLELISAEYDIASLINDAVHLNIMRIYSKPIEFVLKISENLPSYLIGDELRLKQILSNLLSNAFKYTDKGQVTLEIDAEALPSGDTEKRAVKLNIIVQDTGRGMSPEQVQRIFDEYSRFITETNRTVEGTGLGMGITRNLVGMMNGSIKVESELNIGTVFTACVIQQVSRDGVIGKELADNLKTFHYSVERQKKNMQITHEKMSYGSVLIVDDVETNLFVAKGLMSPYGLKITTASSGYETLDLIKGGASYDIVFMDHMMPGMDGIETVKLMREFGYTRPIVALTANALTGQAEIFRENGFNDFISKPIDMRQLNAVLNKIIRDKRQVQPQQTPSKVDSELMVIFMRDARKSIQIMTSVFDKIEQAEDNDLLLFAVNAHAMKSALAVVGETAVSDMAFTLEKAGKSGDKSVITSETAVFIKAINEIVIRFEALTQGSESDSDEDLPYLGKQLGAIKNACAEFDDMAAKTALDNLKKRTWGKDTNGVIDKIDAYLLHSDFEEAALTAEKYTQSLAIPI